MNPRAHMATPPTMLVMTPNSFTCDRVLELNQPINQSISQSINKQPINQSINQSISQSISQSLNKSLLFFVSLTQSITRRPRAERRRACSPLAPGQGTAIKAPAACARHCAGAPTEATCESRGVSTSATAVTRCGRRGDHGLSRTYSSKTSSLQSPCTRERGNESKMKPQRPMQRDIHEEQRQPMETRGCAPSTRHQQQRL